MQIVLPGALPDPSIASQLAGHLPTVAPSFCRWLELARPARFSCQPSVDGCTAFERWQIETAGFRPQPGQNLGAGLGFLRCNTPPANHQPVWLAELAHVTATQEGAILLPTGSLTISAEESVALFQSAHALFEGTGFTLLPDSPSQWRITLPNSVHIPSVSPAQVSASTVNEWWQHDAASQPWRRLFNELQMLWFTHPVNARRQESGQLPVNALWLYGGASADQFTAPNAQTEASVYHNLEAAARNRDWAIWLDELARLEATVFAPMGTAAKPALVLLGQNGRIETRPAGWLRWPGQKNQWRKWWSLPH